MLLKRSLRSRTKRRLANAGKVVAQPCLQIVFDVFQWTVNSDFGILSCHPCNTFEPGPREPRWKVLHCKSRSAGEIALFSDRVQIGNVLTRKAPGAATSRMMAAALSIADKKGSSCDFMSNP
jgi:hypothetical protein